ncbi:P1 family peptidase, partial [Corynebacterium nasicanis]
MLIDVPGLLVGHTSAGDTGVTAIVSRDPAGMVAGVDVRGGGPGTRETDLLDPRNTVERVHAVVLAGGSAFGLAAADGAMRELERVGRGFPVLGEGKVGPRVPIVPAAVIFDLFVGDPAHRPTAEDGAAAVRAALAESDA